MKHPVEGELALLAGHDLDFLSEWRIGRHVARCGECRAIVESYEALRPQMAPLGEMPADIAWNRLASEMKANIRLGLSAGECVASSRFRPAAPAARGFSVFKAPGYQTALAYAGVVLLVVAGLWLERSQPPIAQNVAPGSGSELAATRDGVELSEAGGGSFGLRYGTPRDSREINYSADAKGAMGARYVDTRTGYVTVVSMNVE